MKISSETIVYAVKQHYTEFVKIGLSRNVRQRVRIMRTNNPFPLTTAYQKPFPTYEEARAFEKRLHTILANAHVTGEWFCGGIETIIGAIKEAEMEMAQ